MPVKHREHEDVDLNDVHAVFDDIEVCFSLLFPDLIPEISVLVLLHD